jgi:hypothetical protein
MSDFGEGYEPEPTKPAPITKDELTEPLGCVVVRPLVANRATPPGGRQSEDCLTAAQEDIQRLSALVRAQQITIDKLEQARSASVQVSPLEFVTMVMEKEHLVGEPLFWAEWPNKENT